MRRICATLAHRRQQQLAAQRRFSSETSSMLLLQICFCSPLSELQLSLGSVLMTLRLVLHHGRAAEARQRALMLLGHSRQLFLSASATLHRSQLLYSIGSIALMLTRQAFELPPSVWPTLRKRPPGEQPACCNSTLLMCVQRIRRPTPHLHHAQMWSPSVHLRRARLWALPLVGQHSLVSIQTGMQSL